MNSAVREKAALAKENVRAFFDSCVPSHRKQYFSHYAKRDYPEVWDEIEKLKEILNSSTDMQSVDGASARYVYLSKTLIRKVSFTLARAVLP